MKSITTSLGAVAIASEEVAVMRRVMLQRARVLAVAMKLVDFSEEPAVQDGEPVTLDAES